MVLSIVIIVIEFDGTYGGHVPCGVIAHGSPGGPLQFDLSLAKTPRRLNVIHVTCDITSSYVIDFKCGLDFGEGQPKS